MEMNDISSLATLLRENGDKVINGQSKLSLTITLLKNINEAFTAMVDNDSNWNVLLQTSSRDEIIGDIQFLHNFVQKTVSLKLTNSMANVSTEDAISICKFTNLKYLELRKVPVHALSGIQGIRAQLQSVVCIRSIKRLEDLLLDCGADHSSGFVWSDLREAVFSYNGIDLLTNCFEFTPWLQILDLSHNRITCADDIDCLPNLKYLNLSYNLLESIPAVHRDACRKLQVLVIKNNYIENLSGVTKLETLMELDLSCNCLSSHESLNPLLHLSALIWLSLEGNPVSFHPQHRILTVHCLHNNAATSKFMLDRVPLSKSERLGVGSSNGTLVRRFSLIDDNSSAGSSSASEKTLVAEKNMKQQQNQGSKKSSRVREAVISEHGDTDRTPLLSSSVTSSLDLSTDHLETKKQIETIRERFGEDNWLHSHAGSRVQDVLGLQKSISVPSPIKLIMGTSFSRDTSTTNVEEVQKDSVMNKTLPVKQILEKHSPKDPPITKSQNLPPVALKERSDPVEPEPFTEKESESVEKDERDVGNVGDQEEGDETEEKEEEEEEEGEEQLYLVQKYKSGVKNDHKFFLVVTGRLLKEKEALSAKTREKWTMDSLLSCVRIGKENESAIVQLTFDTIRRDRQERTYVMDENDAQRLIRTLGEVLESRPLTAMNQSVFRCMKCSTQFSHEMQLKGMETSVICPTCNSTLVIEMDEVPLPSYQKENRTEKPKTNGESGASSKLNSSPSQSSIGKSGIGTGVPTVTGGGDRLQVTAMVHCSEVQQPLSCSAASFDPFANSPNNTSDSVRRWDSDIEIISNPSQSSIEVLDEQRMQGSGTPGRKRSSEERQIVSITVPVLQPSERNNHMLPLPGLTESSSSGSFTDSICTTYELPPSSLPSKHGKSKVEEVETDGNIGEDNINTKYDMNGGVDLSSSELIKEEKDGSSNLLFQLPGKIVNPQTNYAIMLEGLLQNVGSKLTSKTSDKVQESQNSKESDIKSNKVDYSYTDFSLVDHRVKLYLYLHIFQQEGEELVFLIRAQMMTDTSESSFPGLLVASTKNLYVLQIIGEEGDDPEKWLNNVQSTSVENVLEIFPLIWNQGIGLELKSEGAPSLLLVLLQDEQHTKNLISFLSDGSHQMQCRMKHSIRESQVLALQQLLLSSVSGEDIDSNVYSCTLCTNCAVQRNEEMKEISIGAIIVTSTDLVMTDEMHWLVSTKSVIQTNCYSQKMSNLVEVGIDGVYQLILNFLDEVAGTEEVWKLTFGTESSLQMVVSSIRVPWERLFSVPLTVIQKNT